MNPCRVCGASAEDFGAGLLLRQHHVRYFRCRTCGFVQTEPPYWLKEAYAAGGPSDHDLGIAMRPMRLAPLIESLLVLALTPGPCVDYGGGCGLLTRIMRDQGFNFFHFDRYCENVFAKHFEAAPGGGYTLATAFEVFEHLPDPATDLTDVLSFSRTILFTTDLLPTPTPPPGCWWYYAPETGQHVAFYSRRTLEVIAEAHRLRLHTDGAALHLLTDQRVPRWLVHRLFRGGRALRLLTQIVKRRYGLHSRLASDWELVKQETAPSR